MNKKLSITFIGTLLMSFLALFLGGAAAHATTAKALPRTYSHCDKWSELYSGAAYSPKSTRVKAVVARECFTVHTEKNGSATLVSRLQVKVRAGHAENLSVLAEWASINKSFHKTGDNGKGVTFHIKSQKSTRTFTYKLGTMRNVAHKAFGDAYLEMIARSGKTAAHITIDSGHDYNISAKSHS